MFELVGSHSREDKNGFLKRLWNTLKRMFGKNIFVSIAIVILVTLFFLRKGKTLRSILQSLSDLL